MSYNKTLQSNNTDLQAVLNAIKALPEGDGTKLPTLTNPGTADDLLLNKQLIDGDGNILEGIFTIEDELTTQDSLIIQIQSAVDSLPDVGSGEPMLQSKVVAPSTSSQTVVADSGYDGLSEVIINAIPNTYVQPSFTKAAATYTPTTTDQIIAAGTYLTDVQTIKGDSNLVAENIKSGVSIFGVNGTLQEGSGSSGQEGAVIDGTISGAYVNDRVAIIRPYAFYLCSSLISASFTACTTIGSSAFYSCTSLTTISFPACTTISNGAFCNCNKLTTVSFPACTTIGSSTFSNCNKITTALLPACTTIPYSAFYRCFNLTSASFAMCTTIGSGAFLNCNKLSSIQLEASSVCSLLNSNAFQSTPFDGYSVNFSGTPHIYVPASLVSAYQSATNWTYFSSYFSAIEDMEV